MKKLVSLLLAAVLLCGVAGCQDEPAPPSEVSSSEPVSSTPAVPINVDDLVVSVGAQPETLDPAGYQTVDDATILSHMFEGLITINEEGTPVPGQAESYVCNDDQTVCTFTLRENLTWSDGQPLTASDFVYSWRRALVPAQEGDNNSYMFSIIKGYREALGLDYGPDETRVVDARKLCVSAPDDRTLVVEINGAYDDFILMCSTPAFFPVRQDVVEENPDWANRPNTFVCNGPYVMTAWKHNSYVRLTKNEHYRNVEAIGPETIEFVLGGNSLSMLSAFQKGELMFADTVPYTELSQFEDSDEYYNSGNLGTYYLGYNMTRAPLDDQRVRMALSLAINRDYICKWVTMSGDTSATALVCDGIGDAEPSVEFRAAGNNYFGNTSFEQQVEQARELLAEAGYPEGQGLAPLTYLTLSNAKDMAVAYEIAAMWQEYLGVECVVETVPDMEFNDRKNRMEYDIISDQYVDTFNDPLTILGRFQSEYVQNVSGYQSAEYDALLAHAAQADDDRERYRLYHQAEDMLMTEAVVCPVYFLHYENYVKRNGVDGFYITPTGYKFFMYVHNDAKAESQAGSTSSDGTAESVPSDDTTGSVPAASQE